MVVEEKCIEKSTLNRILSRVITEEVDAYLCGKYVFVVNKSGQIKEYSVYNSNGERIVNNFVRFYRNELGFMYCDSGGVLVVANGNMTDGLKKVIAISEGENGHSALARERVVFGSIGGVEYTVVIDHIESFESFVVDALIMGDGAYGKTINVGDMWNYIYNASDKEKFMIMRDTQGGIYLVNRFRVAGSFDRGLVDGERLFDLITRKVDRSLEIHEVRYGRREIWASEGLGGDDSVLEYIIPIVTNEDEKIKFVGSKEGGKINVENLELTEIDLIGCFREAGKVG